MSRVIFLLLVIVGSFNLYGDAPPRTERLYLSGTGKDNTVTWDFFVSEGMNSKQWSTIEVPSCWELQGFGAYNYGHDDFDDRLNEYGLYKYEFQVPDSWGKDEIRIVFEGVMTDAEVKINGKMAGPVHQGAFYEFKYPISDLLNYDGVNTLEVRVDKASSNESINHAERKADFWIFGGIFRPVYLERLPADHIDRVATDAQADGSINADVYIRSDKAERIELELYELDGTPVRNVSMQNLMKEQDKWSIKAKAPDVKTWNPESPKLYTLRFNLLDTRGAIVHQVDQRIGFRTVEVLESDGIYVNDVRIKLKGVNRHSFYPESGRTTSRALSIEHVKMMKEMNMNAVRMSHYPPDVHFLDVCDSLGLFVIDEVCTWHKPKLDTEVGRKIVRETVIRDVNHPSIILWANGNETGWNTELDDDYARWDIQQREVIHPWNIFRKTNTLHYFNYHALANDAYSADRILFPTEFLHGLYDGGHGAGLDDYWKLMWNMPTVAGGFLWDFADEAVVRTDKNGVLDTDGNHAADGIVGPYGEKEASFFTIKEIWSPVYVEDRFIREDFNGVFRVENRYHFTSLDNCTMTAKWMRFNGPDDAVDGLVLDQRKVNLPALNPGEKGSFFVEKPAGWTSAHALHLTATDKNGNEIFTWSYPVMRPEEVRPQPGGSTEENKLESSVENDRITVQAGNMTYTFSGENGRLLKVLKGNELIPLRDGPTILGHQDKVDTITVSGSKEKIEIVTLFEKTNKSPAWASVKEKSADRVQWTVYPDGLLNLYVEFKGKRIAEDLKGISFSFPESAVKHKKWLGDGPYRVWRNRMKGSRFQVWENEYNNTVTGEAGMEYPEFKGYFSNLYWAKVEGRNNNGFTVFCHSPQTFFRMLSPKAHEAGGDPKKRVSPYFPAGDISFLKNIAPIGTKFQHPETMGPQGNAENYFGNDDNPMLMELTFKF